MAPRYVCALVISAGVISLTGLLTSWMMGFEKTETTKKSLTNPFTINTNTAQTEKATSAESEGVSNKADAQIITSMPRTASMKIISGTSGVSRASSAGAIDDGTTARSTVRSEQTRVISSEDTQKLKTAVLPATEKDKRLETTPDETVITCTEIVDSSNMETLTNTERMRVSEMHKSETDVATFEKTKEVSITVTKQELGTTLMTEAMTKRVTHFRITSEFNRPESTFRTAAILTKTEGNSAPSTVIKNLKTAEIQPSKVETSETTTVRPQEATQAIKTSNAPTMLNEATGMNRLTMIQTTHELTGGRQFRTAGEGIIIKSTIKATLNNLMTVSSKRQTKVFDKLTTWSHKSVSPCRGKCSTKSTSKGQRGKGKKPLDKTLYSAIIMGCILVVCAILALIVFVKDFIRH